MKPATFLVQELQTPRTLGPLQVCGAHRTPSPLSEGRGEAECLEVWSTCPRTPGPLRGTQDV